MEDSRDNVSESSTFGQLLREMRFSAGLSQEVLAERSRLSVACVSALERGVRRAPYRETVALLAAALELSPRERLRLQAASTRPYVPPRFSRSSGERTSAAGEELLHDPASEPCRSMLRASSVELIAATLRIALSEQSAAANTAPVGLLLDARFLRVLGNVAHVLAAASTVTEEIIAWLSERLTGEDIAGDVS